jgi:hypothetical protein
MAKEGATRTFSNRIAGDTRAAGSPYLQSFVQPAEVARTAQFERALQMERSDREQDRALRQEEFQNRELEYRQKAEDRRLEAANLAIRKQDAQDALKLEEQKRETEAAEVAGRIGLLNEASPSFREDLKKIVSDNAKVFTSKYAKFPLAEMEVKKKEHGDYMGWLSKKAQEVGYSGDVYALPKNDMGEFDTTQNGQIFGPKGVLTTSFAQKQLTDQQNEERALQEANRRSYSGESTSVTLRDGSVVKIPAQKPINPVEIQEEFTKTYGAPVEALSQPYGVKPKKGTITVARGNFEGNDFVPSENGDFVQVIDATKGMEKSVKHRIPYERFESYRSKVGNGKPSQLISAPSGVEINAPFGVQNTTSPSATSLPQAQTEATTDSPTKQPKPLGEIF